MKALDPASLYTACDFAALEFETSDDLEALEEIAGQDRALEALRFGVGVRHEGYNLFVMGPSGMGKSSATRQYLEQQASGKTPPDDWCYVNNFEHPQKPKLLRLPAGTGKALRKDIHDLIEDLLSVMPSTFESDQYRIRNEEIESDVDERREQALQALTDEAEAHAVRLVRTPRGFSFQPMKDGEVITPDDYMKLADDERKKIEEIVSVLQEKLEHIIRQFHQWKRDSRQKIRELNREVAKSVVAMIIDELKIKYQEFPAVCQHLDAFEKDVIEHTYDFLNVDATALGEGSEAVDVEAFGRYEINILVDNSEQKGLPVIYEDNPTLDRLLGRVEHIAQMGTLITDFRLIKAGALHCANGGFLILDVVKLLTQPYAWAGLKRALSTHEIKIQSLGQMLSIISTVSIEPESIPLDIKVVLLGERQLFYLLLEYDPEFSGLFKVAADFESSMPRSIENQAVYARMIATIVHRKRLRPFERAAMARIIEHSARLVSDAERLSSHLLSVSNLMCEADHLANEVEDPHVTQQHVQQAINGQIRRADRLRDRIYEEIKRGTFLIDTDGEKVGQVNGLSVADLGNFSFSQPFRITATARLGHGEVVDIEREVELGGAIHSKGVMIVASFLGERYAKNQPLSLTASLVFEQSYGGVEGDSASVAELCALLSALAEAPIRQWMAVTGSVNQHGQVQAIGGVNEKIEGFFDVCVLKGLTGQQGVVIPASNVKHLMLRADVVAAATEGRFQIFAISTIDEAIELLTGITAGGLDEQGLYPAGSINFRVQTRLAELSTLRREFGDSGKDSDED
ncbi:MAG: ATP-binding protein [Gammaproteobacteria bacterium]|nr:ATP-binding protein [Gammaproteobacteria bacterium]